MTRAPLVAVLAAWWATAAAQSSPPNQPIPFDALRQWFGEVSVITDGKRDCRRLDTLLAATPQQRARGLMFVKSMPEDAGMLFYYPSPRPISMWMKNTLIPLDIVFVDGDRRIVSIAMDTVPLSLTSVLAEGPSEYALELNAGMADVFGLAPGQRLHIELP
jgi:uncharacterized membrane protein (UPF0127 family)